MHKATELFCSKNPNVIFTRADKGNTTVAFNKIEYIEKIENILQDRNTYVTMKKNPSKQIETKLNSFLKSWLKKGIINQRDVIKLR